jgi:hypothetical protein
MKRFPAYLLALATLKIPRISRADLSNGFCREPEARRQAFSWLFLAAPYLRASRDMAVKTTSGHETLRNFARQLRGA